MFNHILKLYSAIWSLVKTWHLVARRCQNQLFVTHALVLGQLLLRLLLLLFFPSYILQVQMRTCKVQIRPVKFTGTSKQSFFASWKSTKLYCFGFQHLLILLDTTWPPKPLIPKVLGFCQLASESAYHANKSGGFSLSKIDGKIH